MIVEQENKNLNLVYDKLTCIFNSSSSSKSQSLSILETLCLTYNSIANLKIEISYSHNQLNSAILIDNLPNIRYGNSIVSKNNIPLFFKVITGIDHHADQKEISSSTEFEMLEKLIFTDLQLLINYYIYLKQTTKTNMLVKLFKVIYSPIESLFYSYNDSKIALEISKLLNVFTKEEVLNKISKINTLIESYLSDKGEQFYSKISERLINSLDLAIYSAICVQKNVLKEKILKDFVVLINFEENFMDLVLKTNTIKNQLWSLNAKQYEEFHPKVHFVDKKFKKHTELLMLTDEEKKSKNIRNGILSGCFLGFIFFLKYFYKNE